MGSRRICKFPKADCDLHIFCGHMPQGAEGSHSSSREAVGVYLQSCWQPASLGPSQTWGI